MSVLRRRRRRRNIIKKKKEDAIINIIKSDKTESIKFANAIVDRLERERITVQKMRDDDITTLPSSSNKSKPYGKVPDVFLRNNCKTGQELINKLQNDFSGLLKDKKGNRIFQYREPTTPIPNHFKAREKIPEKRLDIVKVCFKARDPERNRGLNVFIHTIKSEPVYTQIKTPGNARPQRVCQLRFVGYGVDEFGRVLRVETHGHSPNMYASYPYHWNLDKLTSEVGANEKEWQMNRIHRERIVAEDLELIRRSIDRKMKQFFDTKKLNKYAFMSMAKGYKDGRIILGMEVEWNIPGYCYNGDNPQPFIKIHTVSPEIIPYVRRAMENPFKRRVIIQKKDDRSSYLSKIDGWLEEDKNLLKRLFQEGRLKASNYEIYQNPLNTSYVFNTNFIKGCDTYESDIDYTLRYQADMGISVSTWWKIKDAQFEDAGMFAVDYRISTRHHNLVPCRAKELVTKKPEMFMVFFDDEMTNLKNSSIFPRAENNDPILQKGIQIVSTKVVSQGMNLRQAQEAGLMISLILTWEKTQSDFVSVSNTYGNQYKVNVLTQKNEATMLRCWESLCLAVNAFMYIHYNGNDFDWPYIINRMYTLLAGDRRNCTQRKMFEPKINDWCCFTKDFRQYRGMVHKKKKKKSKEAQKRASVRDETSKTTIQGVCNFDMLNYVKAYAKFGLKNTFNLDHVSEQKLGEKKLEIDHSMTSKLWQTEKGRLELAKYCNRDVELMTRLMTKMGMLEFLYDMGRRTSVPIQTLVDRGVQFTITSFWFMLPYVKNFLLLYKEGKPREFMKSRLEEQRKKYFPRQKTMPKLLLPTGIFYVENVEGPRTLKDGETQKGAVVIEPIVGPSEDTNTLDLKSLYPSIMMCWNVCPTTLIPHKFRTYIIRHILKEICEGIGLLDKNNNIHPKDVEKVLHEMKAIWTRREYWYGTDDDNPKTPAKYFKTLKEAVKYLKSPECHYDDTVKEEMNKRLLILEDKDNKELVEKWLFLAERGPTEKIAEAEENIVPKNRTKDISQFFKPQKEKKSKFFTSKKDKKIQESFNDGGVQSVLSRLTFAHDNSKQLEAPPSVKVMKEIGNFVTKEEMCDIYLKVVEPACQIMGRMKMEICRPDMPTFIQESVREGVFPKAEKDLSCSRVDVKKEIAKWKTKLEILRKEGKGKDDLEVIECMCNINKFDVWQLAIKQLMNSIYGFFASKYKLRFTVAETITDSGRSILETSKCFLDNCVSPYTGFIGHSVTIYGDTDSNFGRQYGLWFTKKQKEILNQIDEKGIKNNDQGLMNIMMEVFSKNAKRRCGDDISISGSGFFNWHKNNCTRIENKLKRVVEEREKTKTNEGYDINSDVMKRALAYWVWNIYMKDMIDVYKYYEENKVDGPEFITKDAKDKIKVLEYYSHWIKSTLKKMGVKEEKDIYTSKWTKLGRASKPPMLPFCYSLDKKIKTDTVTLENGGFYQPSDEHFRKIIIWLKAQILSDESVKQEVLLNEILKNKFGVYIIQEFEKLYRKIIIIRKKKYAGEKAEPGDSGFKFDATGLAFVRGDAYPLKREICKKIVDMLIRYDSTDMAMLTAYKILSYIASGEANPHELIQSKGVKKSLAEYGEKQPFGGKPFVPTKFMPTHIRSSIIEHLTKGNALPEVGSRYSFLVIDTPRKDRIPIGNRACHPKYILNGRNIKYDRKYYMDSAVKMVSNILAPICANKASMLERYLRAEVYRRIRDDESRRKEVDDRFDEMRKDMRKHLTNYCKLLSKSKAKVTMETIPKKYLHGTYDSGSSKKGRTVQIREDLDPDIGKIVKQLDSMILVDNRDEKKQKNDIDNLGKLMKSMTFHDDDEQKRFEECMQDVYDPLDLNNIENHAKRLERQAKRKRTRRRNNANDEENKKGKGNNFFVNNNHIRIEYDDDKTSSSSSSSPSSSSRFATKTKKNAGGDRYCVKKKQSSILFFAKTTKHECIECGTVSDDKVCGDCKLKKQKELEISIRKTEKYLCMKSLKQIDECSKCYGVKYKETKKYKEMYNEEDQISNKIDDDMIDDNYGNRMINDIENCVSDFHNKYTSISLCQKINCSNLWDRTKTKKRLEKIKKLKKEIK